MNTRAPRITIAALCSLLAVSACEPGEEAGDTTGGPAAEAAPVPGVEPAGEAASEDALWTQTLLDSALASFGSDTAAVGRALRSAAAFARQEAEEADETARNALTRSAAELDSLAASIAAGTRHARESVDSAFARLQQAEGLNNLANAADAWASGLRVQAGEKLEAAADNLEQASRNARFEIESNNDQALADARRLAERLRQSREVLADEFRQVTSELEARFRALAERIRPQT